MRAPRMTLSILTAAAVGWSAQGAAAQTAQAQNEVAATPPAFLQLEITSGCNQGGAAFKIVNRGDKWPRTGMLRLYYADDRSLISERRLRLGQNQQVSFIVNDKIAQGRPVGIWVEPDWYERDFDYDASLSCD